MSSDIPHVYSCVHTHIVLNPQILCLKPKQKKSVYSQPYFILSFEVFTDGVEDMTSLWRWVQGRSLCDVSSWLWMCLQVKCELNDWRATSSNDPTAFTWGAAMCKKHHREDITHKTSTQPWGAGTGARWRLQAEANYILATSCWLSLLAPRPCFAPPYPNCDHLGNALKLQWLNPQLFSLTQALQRMQPGLDAAVITASLQWRCCFLFLEKPPWPFG